MPGLRGLLDGLFGRGGARGGERRDGLSLPPVPTSADLLAAVDRIQAEIDGKVPPTVASRVARICATVRETIPRLDQLGPGSAQAHSVVATATSYLPEALGGYLRLPRAWADRRPVDAGKTSLMVLCDQLDLLAAKMDEIFDAVCRADADALVAHGRFLAEKFGAGSLDLGNPDPGGLGPGGFGPGGLRPGGLGPGGVGTAGPGGDPGR